MPCSRRNSSKAALSSYSVRNTHTAKRIRPVNHLHIPMYPLCIQYVSTVTPTYSLYGLSIPHFPSASSCVHQTTSWASETWGVLRDPRDAWDHKGILWVPFSGFLFGVYRGTPIYYDPYLRAGISDQSHEILLPGPKTVFVQPIEHILYPLSKYPFMGVCRTCWCT